VTIITGADDNIRIARVLLSSIFPLNLALDLAAISNLDALQSVVGSSSARFLPTWGFF